MASQDPLVVVGGRVKRLPSGDNLQTSITGNAATVTTNANLTGPVTSSGNATSIGAAAVTSAMLRNSAALSVVGRSANSSGVPGDIAGTDGQALRVSGTTLAFGTLATAAYANSSVTLAKLANIANNTVLGNVSGSSAAPSALTVLQLQRLAHPIGEIVAYAGGSAPSGWAFLDGTAISRSTYADLFSLVGTAFGSGNGTTTFNLPDARGRTLIGVGTGSGLTARSLAATGGNETHTLVLSETPAHAHTIPYGYQGSPNSAFLDITNSGANTGASISTASQGGGGAHANMQPWLALNYIVFLGA